MSMSSESELVVDLCARRPMALRVLARHHIDTATAACPKRTLAACCQDVGLEPGAILAELDTAEAQLVAPWNDRPLSALIDHVLCTYHRPFAGELDDVVCEIDELARVSVSTVASTWGGARVVSVAARSRRHRGGADPRHAARARRHDGDPPGGP
ncbi:MAG: hypothetical protein NT062_24535 [Proteobacteria bacterium]|nr:hypothetical protein [Pseudomonadota bacterium]